MLGRCYLEAGSPTEALSLLEKALEMCQRVQPDNCMTLASIYQLTAKAHLALKENEKALEYLMKGGELLSLDEENHDLLE